MPAEVSDKLANMKIFMTGAGANGCELTKMLSTLGACQKGKGALSISDFDAVDVSNLNR